jgi:hypothetical protein
MPCGQLVPGDGEVLLLILERLVSCYHPGLGLFDCYGGGVSLF